MHFAKSTALAAILAFQSAYALHITEEETESLSYSLTLAELESEADMEACADVDAE